MIVNLHIERLLIDGLPVGAHQGPRIETALAAELKRLVAEGGLSERIAAGRSEPLIRAGPIGVPAAQGDRLGAQIGQAVYGGIGK
jgi:hypothetical protein